MQPLLPEELCLFDELTEESVRFFHRRYNRVNRWVVADLLRRGRYHQPDRTALIFKDRHLSYAELDDECNRVANALLDLGIHKYDRVAILARNTLHHVLTWFGCAKAGAVYLAINYLLGPEEIAYCLQHSASRILVVEDDFYPLIEPISDLLPETLIWSPQGDGASAPDKRFLDFDTWYGACAVDEPEVELHIEDPVQLTYTSGTESLPKGVVAANQGLMSQYMGCIVDGRYEPDDVCINALPLYHCAQRDVFMNPMFWIGGTNVLIRPEVPVILEALEHHGATMFFAPPTVWIGLLNHPDLDRFDLSRLKKCYYGASIMPVEVLKQIMERFPGVGVYNYYGQTELAPYHTILKAEDALGRPASAGRAGLNMETRLENEVGAVVTAPDIPGEICGRGPHAMLCYFRDPEKTEEVMRGGWFHSGDLGVQDEDGYLTVVDRKKDMVKTGGENVSTREVEEVIYADRRVQEVAVIGVTHPKWMEAVTAVVVCRRDETISEEEIRERCRGHLAPFKVPKKVLFVDELPKSPSGKILKRELRETYRELFAAA